MIQSSHRHRRPPPTLDSLVPSLQNYHRLLRAPAQGGLVHPQPRRLWHRHPSPAACRLPPLLRPLLSPMVHHSYPTSERLFIPHPVGPCRFLLRRNLNPLMVRTSQPGGMSSRMGVVPGLSHHSGCRASSRPPLRLHWVRSRGFLWGIPV